MPSLDVQDTNPDNTASDNILSLQSTATGQSEGVFRKLLNGVGALSIGAAVTAASSFSTSALPEEQRHVRLPIEQVGGSGSVAQALSKIADQYECVLFSYPAVVTGIGTNASGDPVTVTLLVSVDGNDTVVRRPIRQFGFEVRPDMRLIVDGVNRGGVKQLAFRVAQPVPLDEEEEDLLRSIVSAFQSGPNA